MNTPSPNLLRPIRFLAMNLAVFTLLAQTVASVSAQGLVHRYSFTSDATDSVGNADGTAVATANGFPPDFFSGEAFLDGVGGYIDLPNGIISSLTKTTIEAWVTLDDNENWARLFDFGNSNIGEAAPEDTVGTPGVNYMFLTPNGAGSGNARFAIIDSSMGGETPVLNDTEPFPVGEEVHVAVVYGPPVANLYVNGRLAASGAATIPLSVMEDVNNWLGRSQWPDPAFAGSYNEFRIHDIARSSAEIAASHLGGPDSVSYDAGTVTAVTLTVDELTMDQGRSQTPTLSATYSIIGELSLSLGEAAIESSDPSIVTVAANGNLQSVGEGTATITATVGGQSSAATITVNPPPGPTGPSPAATLAHRYSFTTDASDAVGGANGDAVAFGNGAPPEFTGGQVVLDGVGGYVDLPNGIISTLDEASFEAWVTVRQNNNWARIFDFGTSTVGEAAPEDPIGTGLNYLFLTPNGAGSGNARFTITDAANGSERPVLNDPVDFPLNQEVHVAVTYGSDTVTLYVNGTLAAEGTVEVPLSTVIDENNWLGRSQWADPALAGSFNEFRIYNAALSEGYILQNFAAGPDDQDLPGAPPPVEVRPDPAQSLAHRYSFTSDASDSVGNADGAASAFGNGAPPDFVDGQAVLDGVGSYIDLPNGLLSSLSETTLEAWVTVRENNNWARIFDFGASNIGEAAPEDTVGTPGMNYVFLTPNGAGTANARFTITDSDNSGERPVLNDPEDFPLNEEVHVAVTYSSDTAKLFVNGNLAASADAEIALSSLQDVNNWLGRSQWPDPALAGSFNEFRIYDAALADNDIALSFAAGPDNADLPGAPAGSGLRFTGVSLSNGQITIEWSGGGVLESAPGVTGPWSSVANATSPYTAPADQAVQMFRVRQ